MCAGCIWLRTSGLPLLSGSQRHLDSPVEQQGGIGLPPRLF
jgi:hypothetical protein